MLLENMITFAGQHLQSKHAKNFTGDGVYIFFALDATQVEMFSRRLTNELVAHDLSKISHTSVRK